MAENKPMADQTPCNVICAAEGLFANDIWSLALIPMQLARCYPTHMQQLSSPFVPGFDLGDHERSPGSTSGFPRWSDSLALVGTLYLILFKLHLVAIAFPVSV